MNIINSSIFFTKITIEESAHISGGFINESTQNSLPFLREKENNISLLIRSIFGGNDILTRLFSSYNSFYGFYI